jgi:acyl carrier protein
MKADRLTRITTELPGAEEIQKTLEEQKVVQPNPSQTYEAPRTPTEEMLARIWAEILGLDRVGIHENFFDLGGDSLLATQVLSRVRQAARVELPLTMLFTTSFTIADVAAAIDEYLQHQAAPPVEAADEETLAALLDELEGISEAEAKALLAKEQQEAKSS